MGRTGDPPAQDIFCLLRGCRNRGTVLVLRILWREPGGPGEPRRALDRRLRRSPDRWTTAKVASAVGERGAVDAASGSWPSRNPAGEAPTSGTLGCRSAGHLAYSGCFRAPFFLAGILPARSTGR